MASAVFLGLSTCSLEAWATEPAAATVTESAARLEHVQQQIESHHEKIEGFQLKALNFEQDLSRIDREIEKGQGTLRDLQGKLDALAGVISQKEGEIAAVLRQKMTTAEHVKKRLAALYQTGEVGIFNALFSSTDLGALLNLQEYIRSLFQQDHQSLQGYRDQIALLAQAKEELSESKGQLQGLIDQLQVGEAALQQSRNQRDSLLAQARLEQDLSRQALKELEAAAEKLTKTITQAQELERKKAQKMIAQKPVKGGGSGEDKGRFAAQQGRLPPPASGQIIRVFGPYQDPFGNELDAEGIDLSLPPETPVVAISPGRVIFADGMSGYGKLVIVDHGEQYYCLISGLASVTRRQGEDVKTGDVLGLSGQPTGLVNPGLHIEIRHGSTPVDPLLWLDSGQLEMKK